jgi:hypothetical protein
MMDILLPQECKKVTTNENIYFLNETLKICCVHTIGMTYYLVTTCQAIKACPTTQKLGLLTSVGQVFALAG